MKASFEMECKHQDLCQRALEWLKRIETTLKSRVTWYGHTIAGNI